MRDINMKELEKYNTVKYVVNNPKASRKRACFKLGISDRHLRRLIKLYKTKGKNSFIHGNTSKIPVNRICNDVRQSVVDKWKNTYWCCNNTHYSEKLTDVENTPISKFSVRRILLEHDIASKCTHKNTIKRIGDKLKTASMFKPDNAIITSILRNPFSVDKSNQHCRLEPPMHYGEEIQIDGSQEVWFGDSKSTLHLAIDKKDGTFLAGYFHKQETLTGYVHMTLMLLKEFGKPIKFVTDNRGVFTNLGVDASERNIKLTQFGYACKILGIELVTTSILQRKGGIERANRTAQDRIIAELQLMNINTIDAANKVLPCILKDLNKRLNKKIDKRNSVYEAIDPNEDLIQIFSYKTERTTDNGNCIKYKNKFYQLYSNNQLVNILPFTKCLLMDRIDGQIFVSVYNQIYEARKGCVIMKMAN